MTRTPTFPELALLTLRDPHAAAEIILGWNLPKEAIWTGIALVSVIVTMISTLSNILMPTEDLLGAIISAPFIRFIIAAGGFIAMVHAIYWTGLMLGGRGEIRDLMVLLLWLQGLWAVAQAVILVCILIAPVLAKFLLPFIALATIWVFVHFISIGLQLNSIIRAVVVLIVGTIALMIGTGFLLSLIGVSSLGVPPGV